MVDLDRYITREEMDAMERQGKGRVEYDDLGNAVFVPFVKVMDRADMQDLLTDRSLALTVDDTQRMVRQAQPNPQGLRKGYDPYESGILHKQQFRKKKDLRALSQWIQQKKPAGSQRG